MFRLNTSEELEMARIFKENGYQVCCIPYTAEYLERQGTTYLGDRDEIIDQWIDLMDISCPRIYIDEDQVINDDNDWEMLSNERFLNTYRLFEDLDTIQILLEKGYIKDNNE